jgi:hypothetical protein
MNSTPFVAQKNTTNEQKRNAYVANVEFIGQLGEENNI